MQTENGNLTCTLVLTEGYETKLTISGAGSKGDKLTISGAGSKADKLTISGAGSKGDKLSQVQKIKGISYLRCRK